MRRTEAFQGVRMIKFRSVFDRCECRELSKLEADLSDRAERVRSKLAEIEAGRPETR